MRYIHQLWGRPVHIVTEVEEEEQLWTFDGERELVQGEEPLPEEQP